MPPAALQTVFPPPVEVWGLPLTPFTFGQTLDAVDHLLDAGGPAFFVTANLHSAMVAAEDPKVAAALRRAAFVLADGMPLVWASRFKGRPLPERVAGSDLVPALCARAARRGRSVFLLGGAPGVAAEAARVLEDRYPGLRVVGAECPPFRPPTPDEDAALADRIRAAEPDLLFVAFGQPKGEVWIADHLDDLGVPVSVQVGGSLEMLTGRVRRAPRLVQRTGLEWAWRVAMEPRRLGPRYAANALFLARRVLGRSK